LPFSTYAELQTAIVKWAMRTGDTEFEAQVPDFITLAEERTNDRLRVARMETRATLVPDASGVITLPDDYLEWRSVQPTSTGYEALSFVPPDAMTGWLPQAGVPRYFSVEGSSLYTYPAASGNVVVLYYGMIPPLSDADPTNWLLRRKPSLYLYGSLLEAAPYMEEDNRTAVWASMFERAIDDLKSTDLGARFASATARVRGPTP
jgi:hypothetical protein